MGKTLAYKILENHLLEGELRPGNEITIRIDQTLTQDSTGTMVYLQLEAMDVDRVKTELSVAYIDHNTLQTGFENADDHAFIKSVARRHGILFSKPGNGICHQLHLENFGVPGKTLLGSDSHTPTGGGIGMIAIGAGGLDVAVAMAKGAYTLTVPKVLGVKLTGSLKPWVSAKDVILHVLQKLTVKGGVGKIVEYFGEGVSSLTVPDRATITNMGAELGATTSVFQAMKTPENSCFHRIGRHPTYPFALMRMRFMTRSSRWILAALRLWPPSLTAPITWRPYPRSGLSRWIRWQSAAVPIPLIRI